MKDIFHSNVEVKKDHQGCLSPTNWLDNFMWLKKIWKWFYLFWRKLEKIHVIA